MQPLAFSRHLNVRPAVIAVCAAVLAGFSHAAEPLSYEGLFDPDTLQRVDITMDPADWETLRAETRSLTEALAEDRHPDSAESPFTYFKGDATINGVAIRNVGVRKKGFVGSLDREKPSLKLHFKKFEKGRKIAGLEKLTLNNNKQDPAAVHQILAYKLFREAGLVAPRANHALVTVNGETLGIYSHVESLDDEFIKRHFDGEPGSLYEGTVTDFVPGWVEKFETKIGEPNNFADVRKVATAAAVEDDRLIDELNQVIDLDLFYRFWAMEVLVQHWDGYNGNRNNYFIYRPADSERFVFLPWGADHIAARNPFWQFTPPTTVYANSILSNRLYQHPDGREQYRSAFRDLMNTVWNEEELLAELDRIEALIGEHLPGNATVDSTFTSVRRFIEGRREAVMRELNGNAPEWQWPLGEPPSVKRVGSVSGTFSGEWGTLISNPFVGSEASIDLEINESTVAPFDMIGAIAGVSQEPNDRGNSVIRVLARNEDSPKLTLVSLSFNPRSFTPGAHILSLGGVNGVVGEFDPTVGSFRLVGLLLGTVELAEAGMEKESAVSGSFDAEIAMFTGL